MTPLRYLLDTNICIDISKQRPPAAAQRFAACAIGEVGMSLVTFGEPPVRRFAELVPIRVPGVGVGETYGALRAESERAGTPIGNNDLWIAAYAKHLGMTLVTNNTREVDRVPTLALENWAV